MSGSLVLLLLLMVREAPVAWGWPLQRHHLPPQTQALMCCCCLIAHAKVHIGCRDQACLVEAGLVVLDHLDSDHAVGTVKGTGLQMMCILLPLLALNSAVVFSNCDGKTHGQEEQDNNGQRHACFGGVV